MKNKFIQEAEEAKAKQGRFGDNIVIANKEKAKRLKTLHANTPEIVEMINALEKAGDKGLNSIQIADALIQNIDKLENHLLFKLLRNSAIFSSSSFFPIFSCRFYWHIYYNIFLNIYENTSFMDINFSNIYIWFSNFKRTK
jgi:hypothetical protein